MDPTKHLPLHDDRPIEAITREKLLSRPLPFVRMKTMDALGELKKQLEGLTDYQKLCLINRMLTDNVTYDHTFKASSYGYPTEESVNDARSERKECLWIREKPLSGTLIAVREATSP